MNKIEELKKLAMEPNGLEGLGGSYYDLNIDKFAELIVRECIVNIEEWELDSRNHISYMLGEHFGIEE